jgi:hypothetical protein
LTATIIAVIIREIENYQTDMNNSILLRRSLKLLGLSGATFASMLTELRDDGKTTTPATVSRWLTGSSPVEPAVMGWLRELLRNAMLASNTPIIRWPAKRSITFAVGNLKGGVQVSTIAVCLAIISKRKFGLRTTHIFASTDGRRDYSNKVLGDLSIKSLSLSYSQTLEYRPAIDEVVIIDVHRGAAYEALEEENTKPFLASFEPDLFLVPADFDSLGEVQSTRTFVDLPHHRAPIRVLHRSAFLSYHFVKLAADAGFDVTSGQWVPHIMFKSLEATFHPTDQYQRGWPDERQEAEFAKLFTYLINEVGGEMVDEGDRDGQIMRFDIDQLATALEAQQRPQVSADGR